MRALLLALLLLPAAALAQSAVHDGQLVASDERLPADDDPDWTTPVDRYTVRVGAGQTLVADLMSEDASALYPRLLLVSPSGVTVEEDRSDASRQVVARVDDAEGGTWTALVTCQGECDGGYYSLALTLFDEPPAPSLFEAAASGDLAAITAALAEDPYATQLTDGIYRTALMHAAEHGHVEVLRALLDAGAEVNAKAVSANDFAYDQTEDTALHDAARGGHAEAVALLLAAGADPSATNFDGATPLHRAVYAASPAVVRLLLAAGADPSVEGEYEGLAADLAAERRDRESAEYDPVTDDERARLAEIVDLLTR
ncbi:ankyrin repeat domain-containing protein [Rubrivirga sp. IMCC45206]|uniref:ankyrin repeat domain-containing protein n=1 Tax=Rubrivirga sp. IMCC45206 TaxID=3391614 RepID=UPI00398FE521